MSFSSTIDAAQILWDYMRLNQLLEKADAIIALGSYDCDVALYVAELYHQGLAPVIVVSGGVRPEWTDKRFGTMTEAEVYKQLLIENKVPQEAIILENFAMNTQENLLLSEALLNQHDYKNDKLILVQKPSFERRLRATAKFRWPNKECFVTSCSITLNEYIAKQRQTNVFDSLISDFQRLETYRGKFLADEKIPAHVWPAFDYLTQNGYCQRLAEPAAETLRRVA